jgi:tetratricopeptide (TPR) repeat protein
MLNAAEVYITRSASSTRPLRMCDQALDLAETDDEIVDALLLKFDALLGKGETDGAREVCARFPAGPFENPSHLFLVGRAHYEVGDAERAFPLVEEAVKRNTRNAEAWYYLGLIRDERGDTRARRNRSCARASSISRCPAPPWSLSRETFEARRAAPSTACRTRSRSTCARARSTRPNVPGSRSWSTASTRARSAPLDGINTRTSRSRSPRASSSTSATSSASRSRRARRGRNRGRLEREITATFLDPEPDHSVPTSHLN